MEKNGQKINRVKAKRKQEAHASPLGEATCPRREPHSRALRGWLRCSQAEEVSEMIWHSEELDAGLPLSGCVCIARQTLCPEEPNMRPLRSRKDHRRRHGAALARGVRSLPHLKVLMTHQLHTGTSMFSPAPVSPEKRRIPDGQWMQQHADLAWFLGGAALPLTLRTQRTGAATADAGSIHDTQASISFSALFMRDQLLVSGAPQRVIGLQSKVLA